MCCNWGDEVISMSMLEIVNRLQIFFPHERIKALSTASGRASEYSSKSWTSRKGGYGVNPDTSSSLWFRACLAGFQGADGARHILLFVCELLAALRSKGSVGLVKMAVLPWQENGKSRGHWRAATAKLPLENNSWHLLYELVLTCLP